MKDLATQSKAFNTKHSANINLQNHTLNMTHEEWISLRSNGLGGSEVAALLGLSKYDSKLSLWMKKTGRRGETESTEQMRAGNVFEEAIAKEFEVRYGWTIRKLNYIYSHPQHSWTRCNVDYIVQNPDTGNWGILEIKNPSEYARGDWATNFVVNEETGKVRPPKEYGTIPPQYHAQGQFYAGCAGLSFVITCAMIGGFTLVPVYRSIDTELFSALIEEGGNFWTNHVVDDKRPALEPLLESSRKAIAEILGEEAIEGDVLEITEGSELHNLFVMHLEAKQAEKSCKETKDGLAATILETIGQDHAKVTFGGKSAASWSKGRVTKKVDQDLLKLEYPEAYEKVVKITTGKPTLGIRFKPLK